MGRDSTALRRLLETTRSYEWMESWLGSLERNIPSDIKQGSDAKHEGTDDSRPSTGER